MSYRKGSAWAHFIDIHAHMYVNSLEIGEKTVCVLYIFCVCYILFHSMTDIAE